jgi:hypothetical protein
VGGMNVFDDAWNETSYPNPRRAAADHFDGEHPQADVLQKPDI